MVVETRSQRKVKQQPQAQQNGDPTVQVQVEQIVPPPPVIRNTPKRSAKQPRRRVSPPPVRRGGPLTRALARILALERRSIELGTLAGEVRRSEVNSIPAPPPRPPPSPRLAIRRRNQVSISISRISANGSSSQRMTVRLSRSSALFRPFLRTEPIMPAALQLHAKRQAAHVQYILRKQAGGGGGKGKPKGRKKTKNNKKGVGEKESRSCVEAETGIHNAEVVGETSGVHYPPTGLPKVFRPSNCWNEDFFSDEAAAAYGPLLHSTFQNPEPTIFEQSWLENSGVEGSGIGTEGPRHLSFGITTIFHRTATLFRGFLDATKKTLFGLGEPLLKGKVQPRLIETLEVVEEEDEIPFFYDAREE